jgi:hypothetical protein
MFNEYIALLSSSEYPSDLLGQDFAAAKSGCPGSSLAASAISFTVCALGKRLNCR